jgi:hypothetical protein
MSHREKGLTPWLTNEVGARIGAARQSMDRLRHTFLTGDNRHGEYGRNIREAFDRWAVTYGELTGREPPNIYDGNY